MYVLTDRPMYKNYDSAKKPNRHYALWHPAQTRLSNTNKGTSVDFIKPSNEFSKRRIRSQEQLLQEEVRYISQT
jgi:hypothetical protein